MEQIQTRYAARRQVAIEKSLDDLDRKEHGSGRPLYCCRIAAKEDERVVPV